MQVRRHWQPAITSCQSWPRWWGWIWTHTHVPHDLKTEIAHTEAVKDHISLLEVAQRLAMSWCWFHPAILHHCPRLHLSPTPRVDFKADSALVVVLQKLFWILQQHGVNVPLPSQPLPLSPGCVQMFSSTSRLTEDNLSLPPKLKRIQFFTGKGYKNALKITSD